MRPLLATILLLPLVACGTVHRPGCDSSTHTLADDEPLPDLDYTLADLFTSISGERVVPAQVLGELRAVEEIAAISVSVTPGGREAAWTDSEAVDNVSTTFWPGDEYLDMAVMCDGGLKATAKLDIAREDDAGSLASDAILQATPDELVTAGARVYGTDVTGVGDWSEIRSSYAGFEDGRLTGVQLQTQEDIVLDWR